jgi:hypothetical protein
MKIGTEDKKKLMIAGVLGFVAIFAGWSLYSTLFGGTTSAPPPPPVVTTSATIKSVTPKSTPSAPPVAVVGGAQKVASTAGQLDPTLHMEAMLVTESLVYSGTGRNIFATGPSADEILVKIEKPVSGPRPNTGPPPPPRPPAYAGPPPINLKFFGTATSANGTRRAFLLNGDDVWLASVGDVVERRYRIVSIAATSILVEDIPNSNKQTLPLVPN